MNPRFWITAAAVAIVAPAHAETTNEVRAVTFTEDAGVTRVNVRAATTPTFTVYKLERPGRVVVDLPHTRLSDVLRGHETAALMQPNTWGVSTIAAQQLDDGAVRVIVTMARPGRYDVKTDGNELVVSVMPRDAAPKTTNPAELEAAKKQAEAAMQQANAAKLQAESATKTAIQSKADAESARSEAERLRKAAADQAAKAEAAQKAVAQASAADIAKAKSAAKAAQDEAAKVKTQAEDARKTAALAQIEADKQRIAAEQARLDAIAEATKAKTDAAKAKADAERARAEMARQKTEAEVAKQEASTAKQEASVAMQAATAAKRDAAKTREEALAMKAEAEAAKKEASAAKADATKMMTDAKRQVTAMEQKQAQAQAMEDKARTALATAQAREEAARDTAAKAAKERELAEVAMKKAKDARDNADAANRSKMMAEMKAAEDRLAKARAATADADSQRKAAELAASNAKQDLESSKSALATVESQRAAAVAAATDAARKRSEAESAASEAARKRREAEVAATEANKRKGQAESDRAVAESQRVAAEDAARAAEKQRKIAEASAKDAINAKREAESSLASLTRKKVEAERAAEEVSYAAKAQAKAEAEMAAAKARKAGDDEIAAARREVAKLTEERKQAESELADRRKAVAQQQSEAARLETAAAQARDAAAREEARKTQLAQQREDEERQLAKVKAQKVQAQVAAATPATTAPVSAPALSVTKPIAVARVNTVTFKGNESSGVVEFAMAGEGNIELGEMSSSHVELIVDNAQLAQKMERTLDVSKFGSPVKKISTYNDRRSPNRVRLVAELQGAALPTVVREPNGIVRWRFASNGDVATASTKKPIKTTNIPPTVVGGFGAASTPVTQQSVSQLPGAGNRRRTYYGATVEFDFKDAPIHDLLRIIADTGGVNIVVPDTIDAKVTVRLKRVPWDQALEVILASHGLWYRREGNLYRIAPRKELDAEDEAEAARRAAAVQAEAPKPEVVTLNYASADELKAKLEGMLSPKGKIEVDGRTNSLIINDVAYNRESIARLALQLDTQTPQITIEARIVEAQSTFVRQFGIQWGGRALAGAAGGNATGLVFPSSIGVRGGNTDGQTPENGVNALPSDFAINLPAATGTGEGGAIGMSLGSVGGNFNINLRLSALEDTGTVRIVSAPKVTVLNNKAATIKSGVSIPISVVSAAGTQTQFVQADLKLEVTPYVSQRDCSIAMQLNVTKNEPDFVNTGARGDPTILRREAQTTMLVADGETSVLGGIYTRNSGLSYKKVPFFADLPVIGWFFKSRRENDTRTEILVFITPKITNKASLRCVQ